MMATDNSQEAVVPVHSFLQTTYSKIRKWKIRLPSSLNVLSMRGGLGGNTEFEEAAIEARSEGSKWVEVLVEGMLGRNHSLKPADAKQASDLQFPVF